MKKKLSFKNHQLKILIKLNCMQIMRDIREYFKNYDIIK